MGLVYANIELLNPEDVRAVRRGLLGEDEIRRVALNILVDSGAVMLVINEEIQAQLGLDEVIDHRISVLANGDRIRVPVVGPVEVRFEGRVSRVDALVMPGFNDPLLGAMPMEELDVFIHPARNVLSVMHPEGPVMMLK